MDMMSTAAQLAVAQLQREGVDRLFSLNGGHIAPIIMRPASVLAEPAFQDAIKIIRDADVAFGNFEGSISDLENFDGPIRGFMRPVPRGAVGGGASPSHRHGLCRSDLAGG